MPTILIRIELLELELQFKYLESEKVARRCPLKKVFSSKTFSLKNIRDVHFHLIKFQTKGLQIY